MNERPRQVLVELIAKRGRELCNDPRQCKALLKDYCGEYKREVFLLTATLEAGVANEISQISFESPIQILLNKIAQRLEDELGLSETAAVWVVETWALALGIITKPYTSEVQVQTSSILSPETKIAPPSGGVLHFPKVSVGQVFIDGTVYKASGKVEIPTGKLLKLNVAKDIEDFTFLLTCDPDTLIRHLSLNGCRSYLNDDMPLIRSLNKIETLDLGGEDSLLGITHQVSHWEVLHKFNDLKYLNLVGCNYLSEQAVEYISKINSLEELHIGDRIYCSIGDDLLKHIGNMHRLKVLSILNCSNYVTGPAVLNYLGNMTQLEKLDLSGCSKISKERMKELKELLPTTQVKG